MEIKEETNILNEHLKLKAEIYQNCINRYEKMTNISNMRKLILDIGDKIFNYELAIDILKKTIKQKQSDLQISSRIYHLNNDNYKDKLIESEKNK